MNHAEARALGARCDLCPLSTATVVAPQKNEKPLRLVVVGEGPGRVEEKIGIPFSGVSGKFLDERLRRDALIQRSECHVTNAALCRGESDEDNERAAECCAPRLLGELRELPSNVPMVLLGKTAARSVLGVRNILTARGFIWTVPEIEEARVKAAYRSKVDGILKGDTMRARSKLAGRVVLPSIHPAFVLRADTWKPVAELDFRRVGRVVREEIDTTLLEDGCFYSVGGPELLKQLGLTISCDIETDGIKPLECNILSIGLADTCGNVVEIWPWSDSFAPAVARFLEGRDSVVFHNGNQFDLLVLENHGVKW